MGFSAVAAPQKPHIFFELGHFCLKNNTFLFKIKSESCAEKETRISSKEDAWRAMGVIQPQQPVSQGAGSWLGQDRVLLPSWHLLSVLQVSCESHIVTAFIGLELACFLCVQRHVS